MPSAPANPDLLLERLAWRNRIDLWRAQLGESVFSACAAAAFIGAGLWMADPHWTRLLRADATWARPLPAALLALTIAAMLAWRAQARRRTLAGAESDDWLAALPIAPTLRWRARRRRAAIASAGSALAIILLGLWGAARSEHPGLLLLTALLTGAVLGVGIGWILPERTATAAGPVRTRAAAVAIPAGTHGLALLGAALEPAVTRLPRGAPWVAACFMLLPPSTPAIALPGLVLLFTAVSLAFDLIAHWRTRYQADQQWLAAQPLPAQRLFAAYLLPLGKRTLLLTLVVGACLHALGAPAMFSWALALALLLLLADAVLCAFATRRTPARFPLLIMLHATILVASTQVLPPALPLVLFGCGYSAWRRGLR